MNFDIIIIIGVTAFFVLLVIAKNESTSLCENKGGVYISGHCVRKEVLL